MSMTNSNPVGAEVFHKGDRIRKARELAGHADIKAFSEATGLDRGSLGRYEATGEVPRRSTIKSIAMATGVRVEWLESGTGQMYEGDGPGGGISYTPRDLNPEPTDSGTVIVGPWESARVDDEAAVA